MRKKRKRKRKKKKMMMINERKMRENEDNMDQMCLLYNIKDMNWNDEWVDERSTFDDLRRIFDVYLNSSSMHGVRAYVLVQILSLANKILVIVLIDIHK